MNENILRKYAEYSVPVFGVIYLIVPSTLTAVLGAVSAISALIFTVRKIIKNRKNA